MLVDGERVTIPDQFFAVRDGLTTELLQRNLQRFVSGQLLLGLFIHYLTLAFWSLRVPFFSLFAIFIGLMEVIPM